MEKWSSGQSREYTSTSGINVAIEFGIYKKTISMTAIRINHINIRSSAERIETLRVFYCQALGLSEGHRPNFGSHGYWLYASNQALIHLSITGIDEHRGTHVDNTLDHIAFDCENRTATCENLTRMGVEFTVDRVPDTPIVQIFFRDPAGNGIELSFSES